MKKSPLWVALVAGLLPTVLSVSPAFAQQRAAAPAAVRPLGIALLDVNAVFKEHAGFKARMAELEQSVKRAENQVKIERDTMRQLAEQLKSLNEGTPEYKQLEAQLADKQAKLQVQVTMQRKEFLQAEAKVYHMVYQEIEQEVASVAAANNIAVVLRYSGDRVDAEKPDDILRDINKSVVWSAQGLDITPIILERLRGRSAPASYQGGNGTARPGVPFAPRQQ